MGVYLRHQFSFAEQLQDLENALMHAKIARGRWGHVKDNATPAGNETLAELKQVVSLCEKVAKELKASYPEIKTAIEAAAKKQEKEKEKEKRK